MQQPIQIKDLSLIFSHKICFSNFNYTIYSGSKIAIIGDNGSGKSTLLKLLLNYQQNSQITVINDLNIGYVPQIITDYQDLSGGERFNKALSAALANYPDLLLLDEPTNHLDQANRKSLMQMLKNYPATQIIVSHDPELLDKCIDTLWHIHDGKITIFDGKYSLYREELAANKERLINQISSLKYAKREQHQALMKEQQRAKSSRAQGEKHIKERKWPTITSGVKARRAETTSGRKTLALAQTKAEIDQQLSQLWQPEEISYSFKLVPKETDKSIITINNGSCGYLGNPPLLKNIQLNLFGNARIALIGPNGSGKSTLVRAIRNDPMVIKAGEWIVPGESDIAYLDQHYSNLPPNETVIDYILCLNPKFNQLDARKFLNQFLFRKNEEVNNLIMHLSGGEKCRLSLAQIALTQPKLLILDEVSNNIDLTTREHIVQVLKNYPGAMIVISHDNQFLNEIEISEHYAVAQFNAVYQYYKIVIV